MARAALRAFVSVLALLVWASPAAATSWKVHVLRPPAIPHGGSSLVIPKPERSDTQSFHFFLLAALGERKRGLRPAEGIGTDDAVLAWPDALPVVTELEGGLPLPEMPRGGYPAATMEALRLATGGGALVLGTLSPPDVDFSTRTRYQTRTTPSGDQVTIPVHCSVREVRQRFDLVVVDTTNGQVSREPVDALTREEDCPDGATRRGYGGGSLLPPVDLQVDSTTRLLAMRVANRVAPSWTTLKLHLQKTPRTKRSLDQLKRESDRAGATVLALEAAEQHPGHGPARYNAAVFLAVAGHFVEAERELLAAEEAGARPYHREMAEEADRLRSWFRELEAMGIPIAPAPLHL